MADSGKGGFLGSKNTYQDFPVHAGFWAEADTNSGIFMGTLDPSNLGADNSYEVNVRDIRPDASPQT